MQFDPDLTKGTLIKRYKRFLADIRLENGETVTAHCANSGSMMGLAEPGSTVWLSPNTNPKAKLDWRWELASQYGQWVGINTSRPNALIFDWIEKGHIPELAGYDQMKREVKYGANSRIDIFLSGANRPDCYVEIKNVTLMREEGRAEFPDAVTARGTKHLQELSDMVKQGHRAVMVYFAFRTDAHSFEIAKDIDPTYNAAFEAALNSGVEAICIDSMPSPHGIAFGKKLPIVR